MSDVRSTTAEPHFVERDRRALRAFRQASDERTKKEFAAKELSSRATTLQKELDQTLDEIARRSEADIAGARMNAERSTIELDQTLAEIARNAEAEIKAAQIEAERGTIEAADLLRKTQGQLDAARRAMNSRGLRFVQEPVHMNFQAAIGRTSLEKLASAHEMSEQLAKQVIKTAREYEREEMTARLRRTLASWALIGLILVVLIALLGHIMFGI